MHELQFRVKLVASMMRTDDDCSHSVVVMTKIRVLVFSIYSHVSPKSLTQLE
jgi:hypothetical protein